MRSLCHKARCYSMSYIAEVGTRETRGFGWIWQCGVPGNLPKGRSNEVLTAKPAWFLANWRGNGRRLRRWLQYTWGTVKKVTTWWVRDLVKAFSVSEKISEKKGSRGNMARWAGLEKAESRREQWRYWDSKRDEESSIVGQGWKEGEDKKKEVRVRERKYGENSPMRRRMSGWGERSLWAGDSLG